MREITIVCVSYKRYRNLPVLINCFLSQTLQNFKLLILHDGPDSTMDSVVRPYLEAHPDELAYQCTERRYNDYGHSLRDMGIRMCDTEYLLLTNDDNYYCPTFLEQMFVAIRHCGADIAMCDMLHSHMNPGGRAQVPYRYFETLPQRGSMDIGCLITKSACAKAVGFRDKSHDGDATFFEDVVKFIGNPKIVKVNQALFVHN
jgi:glycosyltransferase involved in cell wall biosynthesis